TRLADLPVARLAFELSFDLLALRARCKTNLRCGPGPVKPAGRALRANCGLFVNGVAAPPSAHGATPHGGRIGRVHLRTPSTAKGTQAFVWALVFFLFLFFGMRSIGIDGGTSLA